jgi:hypothetical protein
MIVPRFHRKIDLAFCGMQQTCNYFQNGSFQTPLAPKQSINTFFWDVNGNISNNGLFRGFFT